MDLSYQRELVEGGQWWRILSGQLVHNNSAHLFSNIVALVVCRVLFLTVLSERDFVVSILLCSLITGGFIYFLLQHYDYYLGVSAALYGVWVAGSLHLIVGRHYWGGVLLLVVMAKLLRDYFYPAALVSVSDRIGVPVAVEAHFIGVLAGVLLAVGQCIVILIRPATLPPK